jgi:transcriptional regulator with XRE-family HTH domain
VVAAEPNPTFARRRLAVRLRALRERDDRSLSDLAAHLKVSVPQASRLDTGARGFQPEQVEKLADWYQLSTSERALLSELVVESRKRAWWQQVDLHDSYRTLIGLENAAEAISEYCTAAIPGLLQTPEYAAIAAASSRLNVSGEEVTLAAEVRARRQRQFFQRRPRPSMSVIIDELALARTVGGSDVMARQLDRLLEASSAPRTMVQVVGFEAGLHVGTMMGQSILLDMGGAVPDVLYVDEEPPSDTDDANVIDDHRKKLQRLSGVALDLRASRARIEGYLNRCRSVEPPA